MIEHVWEVEGPCKEFDVYILRGDTEEDHAAALEFVQSWVEFLWDDAEADADASPCEIKFRLRKATEDDRDTILGGES